MTDYEAIIGLETHIQLNTSSKVFCACSADSWEDPPNSNICPVCTGLPGVLPVLNRAVVEKGVLLAAAVEADIIQQLSFFDRKNYFYPDLPKGYQISQYDQPLGRGGHLKIPLTSGEERRISIEKLHIEEDAGKTIYEQGRRLIDFNRCGVPLLEMVTGPDLRAADEAAQYLIRLRQLIRWLGISEGDMERGHLRCDANVSIRRQGDSHLNPKTEIKNLNSIESVRSAIEAEIKRQIREVQAGNRIQTWTLNWDDATGTLHKMRSKETEADYRYFREPDLLPIRLDPAWKNAILTQLPELPLARRERFVADYALPVYDAEILTEERSLSDYFEAAAAAYSGEAKTISNWLMNDVLRLMRENGLSAAALKLQPQHLSRIVQLVQEKVITATTGKELLEKVEESGVAPEVIVEQEGLAQVSDEGQLRQLAAAIMAENPSQVESYREGKSSLIGWFVGQIMRQSGGKANPQLARQVFEALLDQ